MITILSIDTTDSTNTVVTLERGGKRYEKIARSSRDKSQTVLPLIQALVGEHTLSLNDITRIEVNLGPGSFTGLRVGIAIATMLGMLLGVTVNGKPSGSAMKPVYADSKFY